MDRIKLLIRLVFSLLILSVPFFFSTAVSEYFELPKLLLIYAFSLICLLLLGLKCFFEREFKITRTPFDLALGLIFVSLVLATYFGANRVQSVMNGLAPLSVGILLYFLTTHLLSPFDDENDQVLTQVLILSSTLLGLLAFFSYFNINLLPFDFARDRFFTFAGSSVNLILLLAVSAPLSLHRLLSDEKISFKSVWYHLCAANLVLFGLIIILQTSLLGFLLSLPTLALLFIANREGLRKRRSLFSAIGLTFLVSFVLFYIPLNSNARLIDFRKSYPRSITLDNRSSWIISIQSIRDYPIFGSGPGSFLSDFVRYRPGFLNYTPNWFQRFSQAASEPYQVLATTGIFGLAVFLFFVWMILKTILALPMATFGQSHGLAFSLLAFVLALFFSVPSPPLRVIFFILLALYTLKALPVVSRSHSVARYAPPVIALVTVIAAYYLFQALVLGEISFKKALNDVAANNGQGALVNLNGAILHNPYRDNFHLSLASLAYTLANNLAAKPDRNSDEARALIQLINIAINEAKISVNLNPFNGSNIETLATIYHNISGAVENAADWAVTAYRQAILIEPANPNLRFQLGSLFYAAGNFEAATNSFTEATRLKNDHANYHYNLAWTLRNRELLGAAIEEMVIVSRLVPAESGDGRKVLTDLADFRKLAADIAAKSTNQPSTQGQTELEVPPRQGKLAEPTEPKVNLPTEASPASIDRR